MFRRKNNNDQREEDIEKLMLSVRGLLNHTKYTYILAMCGRKIEEYKKTLKIKKDLKIVDEITAVIHDAFKEAIKDLDDAEKEAA